MKGRWRQDVCPWWKAPLEAATDPHVRYITVIASSQTAKTENLINLVLSRCDIGPRVPALIVEPSEALARSISDRFSEAIHQIPDVLELLAKGQRDKTTEKWIGGVRVGFAWSGSKIQLSSHPAGLVVVDEMHAMEQDVGGEGDPMTLAEARTKTYRRALIVGTSTPGVQGYDVGERQFQMGTMEILQWACPHCGAWFQPRPEFVRWPKDCSPAEAAALGGLLCPACGDPITDEMQRKLVTGARYWPHRLDDNGIDYVPCESPDVSGSRRSYWISGANAINVRLSQLTERLRAAYIDGRPEKLQAEFNTWWGVWWQTSGERVELEQVLARASDHAKGEVPGWVRTLVLGVDVQRDRLVWCLVGFGPGFRKAVIDYGELYGDPEYDDVWIALTGFRRRRYGEHVIRGCAIDSGFDPRRDRYRRPEHRVYRYCRINGGWAWAMKGVGQVPGGVKLTKTSKTAVLVLVESAHVKGLIDGELQSEERRLVFPSGVDREFAAQICADELLRLPSGKLAYDSKGRPDHYRDALMHAIALAMFFNLPLHYQQPEQQAHDIPAPRPARIAVNPGMHRGWTR